MFNRNKKKKLKSKKIDKEKRLVEQRNDADKKYPPPKAANVS